METKKFNTFMILYYPDSWDIDEMNLNDVSIRPFMQYELNKIDSYIDEYAYKLHDMDIDEKGEIKKPHIHLVLKLNKQLSASSLAKKLNIESNYIEIPKQKYGKSYKDWQRYLIHKGYDKYQYNANDVNCNYNYLKLINDNLELYVELDKIFENIENGLIKSKGQLIVWCKQNNNFEILHKYYRELCDYLFEWKNITKYENL